ncbi:MAG: hypothetical protein IV086_15555 [Hyphomonadaceae bacterium]|nr:hypothetical protein [Hyphomonadaceae bacterium]
MKKFCTGVFAVLVLAACQPAPAAKSEDAAAIALAAGKEPAPATDAWLGDWTGVEGTMLKIDVGAGPGVYAITETTLDGPVSFAGTADGDVIRFERAGAPETIRAGDGAATGLKYLDGKTDCLVIKDGEGFCRD